MARPPAAPGAAARARPAPPSPWPARAGRARRRPRPRRPPRRARGRPAGRPPSAPVWAAAALAPAGGRADLQHRDADVALGRPRQRARPAARRRRRTRGTARPSRRPRPRPAPRARRRVEHRLVADRRDRVERDPAADGQRVDRHVPALRDERDAAGRPRHERVAPQRRAARGRRPGRRSSGPSTGSGRGGRRAPARPAARRRPPPRTRPRTRRARRSRAARAARTHLGHARGRDRHDDRVDRLGQVLERRHARPPVHLAARRVHAVDRPGEPERRQVEQRRVAVGARPGRSRRRPRPTAAAAAARGRARPRPRAPRGAQRSTFATPRRSSERAMISRWISLVPSQMRSTRSSRRNRSATLSRR